MVLRFRAGMQRVMAAGVMIGAVLASASIATAQEKVLRLGMSTDGPGSLDPLRGSTVYENRCCSQVYQTLCQYKYLVRPLELEPLLLAEMPTVSEDGLTWSFKLRKGVRFHDDPCFTQTNGKGRELVSSDVIYSWKRLADPANEYKSWWLLKDNIAGFDAYKDTQAELVKSGKKFDYDAPVEGMRIVNDHEFEIVLAKEVQQFRWKLAMFQMAIVPREAVEHYGTKFNFHPVGTGPFVLRSESDWSIGQGIVFYRNPNYWDDRYPSECSEEFKEMGLDKAAGTKLPIVDKLDIRFFVESQPLWLGFQNGDLDYTTIPTTGFDEAIVKRTKKLRPQWERKGITLVKIPLLDFIFRAFNMEDPLLGGYTPEKKALRQAISLCMNWDELNEDQYWGTTIIYDGPIPPGLDGYPEDGWAPKNYRGPDYARAREKLKEAGYKIDGNGKVVGLPRIDFYTGRGAESVKIVEQMERNLAEVGIEINKNFVDFSTLMKEVDHRKAQMFSFAWSSDYPDAENNLALFYGPNASPGNNHSNYSRPEYDALYEKIVTMTPGPERTALYEKMRDMIIEDVPTIGSMARTRYYVINPWIKNFMPTEDFYNYLKYLDVDMGHPQRP